MPQPQSAHQPFPTDLPGGVATTHHSKSPFCAPLPLHPQSPLPSTSPRLSVVELPAMSNIIQQSVSSIDHTAPPSFMGLDSSESLQWGPMHHVSQHTAGYPIAVPYAPGSTEFYQYAQNGMSYHDNYNLAYSAQYAESSCPRSYNGIDPTGLPNDISMSESYPPAAYQIEPQRHHDSMDLSDHEINGQLMQLSNDYEHHPYSPRIKIEEYNDYQSPYSNLTRASTPQNDAPRYPHDGNGDDTAIDKEQPYAQLIYQALLQAPEKTMILRDIYDWFKKYTDKAAASETKGWQNSIRHNLSMNGAFEKVDQHCEETRKGFMWRLTDEAVHEGVKSTTRYRSKAPNKRGHRTQQPQPQRQASGAKGGQAARRSARSQRMNKIQDAYRSEPYISRSVPAAFDPSYTSPDALLSYPPSPYYSSDADFGYSPKLGSHDDFGSPLPGHAHLDLFSPAAPHVHHPHVARMYMQSPMAPGMGLPISDMSYVLDQSSGDGLFVESPSPSVDEPRTPGSAQGWTEEVGLEMGLGQPCVFDEMAYREYAG